MKKSLDYLVSKKKKIVNQKICKDNKVRELIWYKFHIQTPIIF